jgi:hypothetical protein
MKKALLLITLLFYFYNSEAQDKWRSEYTLGYYWVNPQGDMGAKIDRAGCRQC